jgi:hypothetical protein
VTIAFSARADGNLIIPPMIVHEGGDAKSISMPAGFAVNLLLDWIAIASPSRYNYRDGIKPWAMRFVELSGASKDNWQYLFMDAHDFHWDPQVLAYLLRIFVRPMFLRSNNSTADQPFDMGCNALLSRSAITQCLHGDSHIQMYFNIIITNAWTAYISDKNRTPIIMKAFSKSNLFQCFYQIYHPVRMRFHPS